MARLNYERLQKAGYTPQQIEQVIAVNPAVEVYNRPEQPISTPQAQQTIQSISQPARAPVRPILSQKADISQAFGNYNPSLYRGINKSLRNTGVDIAVPTGTELRVPPGQWKVVEQGTGWNRGYGNSILVENAQTGEQMRFSHLSKMKKFNIGETVSDNDLVALTGRSGHTTGSHLDWEMYNPQGRLVDPMRTSYADYLFPR